MFGNLKNLKSNYQYGGYGHRLGSPYGYSQYGQYGYGRRISIEEPSTEDYSNKDSFYASEDNVDFTPSDSYEPTVSLRDNVLPYNPYNYPSFGY